MSMLEANMRTHNLALIGFGGVNRTLAELIRDRSGEFEQQLGFSLRIVAITDLRYGSWVEPEGIDPAFALAIRSGEPFPGSFAGTDNARVIKGSNADIVVEATFTSPVDGEPATSHVRAALESGKHVTTTNKGPVALHGKELVSLAANRGVRFEFEGSLLSGTPILRFAGDLLRGLDVTGFEGIPNGTSNYLLGRMENGHSLDQAIVEAQQLGYAEADPSADIGGTDVRLKVVILANQVLGADLRISDVDINGIDGVSAVDIIAAAREGKVWKLIGSASRADDGRVTGSVNRSRFRLTTRSRGSPARRMRCRSPLTSSVGSRVRSGRRPHRNRIRAAGRHHHIDNFVKKGAVHV